MGNPFIEAMMPARTTDIPATSDAALPTGSATSILATTKKYDEFVNRFHACAKQTAQGLIDLITTVAEAKQELAPREFTRFCAEVKWPEGSKDRKWKKIGEQAARFRKFFDGPCNWTTLYALAVLTDEQYDQVTQHPLFGPAMAAKDVKLILSGGSGREVKPMAKLAVDISGLTEQEREAFKQELKILQERFGVRFKMFVGKTAADKEAAAEAEAQMQAIMADLEAEGTGAVQ